jgi:hypothetical protein
MINSRLNSMREKENPEIPTFFVRNRFFNKKNNISRAKINKKK